MKKQPDMYTRNILDPKLTRSGAELNPTMGWEPWEIPVKGRLINWNMENRTVMALTAISPPYFNTLMLKQMCITPSEVVIKKGEAPSASTLVRMDGFI